MSTIDQCPSSKKDGEPAEKPTRGLHESAGRVYWRSLDEAIGTQGFKDFLQREFPAHASELLDGSRRHFLKIMGASLALAGASTIPGCRRPDHKILTYNKKPEDVIPGKPLFYATSIPMPGGEGVGVLAETFSGRPTKLEGNPLHPISRGKSDVMTQASVLNLYDPDRDPSMFRTPDSGIPAATWDEFEEICERDIADYDGTNGKGLAFLLDKSTSPTRERVRDRILERWPEATWYVWEPVDRENSVGGAELAFGEALSTTPRFDKARRIVSIDSDFLGLESTLPIARDYANNRLIPGDRPGHEASESEMSRLYTIESRTTLTGGQSDHRMPARPTRIGAIAVALFDAVMEAMGSDVPSSARAIRRDVSRAAGATELSEKELEFVRAAAADLADHARHGLVVVGETQPAEVHAVGHAINGMLNGGSTVEYREISGDAARNSIEDIRSLVRDIRGGAVSTLITVGANPVYDAPADVGFGEAYGMVGRRVHFGQPDETAARCTHYLGRSHALEQWSDVLAADGTHSVIQPMIAPIFDTKGDIEFLSMVLGETTNDAFDLVRETLRTELRVSGPEFEKRWRRALHNGRVENSAREPVSPRVRMRTIAPKLGPLARDADAADGLDVVFLPDSTVHDGRYANNGWLQELPDAVTKVAWDNPMLISRDTAIRLGLETDRHSEGYEYNHGQMVRVELDGRTVELPVWVVPGMPKDTIVLTLGYGRKAGGRVAQGTGYDVYPIRRAGDVRMATGATVAPAEAPAAMLACTQDHWAMEGRAIMREVDLPAWQKYGDVDISEDAEIQKDPYDHSRNLNFAGRLGNESHTPANVHIYTDEQQKVWGGSRSLTQQYLEVDENGEPIRDEQGRPVARANKYGKRYQQWGMSIDLNTCTGCGACTVACQAENNIPIVGKTEVAKGREMSWIRVDRYFSNERTEYGLSKMGGEEPEAMWESPDMTTMPVACVHCESAPCEVVCPVNATVHSDSGTNDMAYNRCIGTRYCSNNCPYKVRRFNFFDYATKEYKGGFGQLGEGIPDDYMPENQNFVPPRFREPVGEVKQMQHNPHVTVRSRGVMEKCTYCMQRINAAKVETKLEDMEHVPDGFFQVACQQACPSDSIVFGDIYDYESNNGAGSRVHQQRTHGRTYALLAYLNTRPRTTYMIRLRNPNPALREPIVDPFHHGDHGDDHGDGHGGEHNGNNGHASADPGRLMSLPVLSNTASGALLS